MESRDLRKHRVLQVHYEMNKKPIISDRAVVDPGADEDILRLIADDELENNSGSSIRVEQHSGIGANPTISDQQPHDDSVVPPVADDESVKVEGSESSSSESKSGNRWLKRAAGIAVISVVGGVCAIAAVPAVLGAVGFTAGGIAANSIAASMMSAAAIANGGGVAAGSAVAVLQSVGAAGLGASGTALVGGVAGSVTAGVSGAVLKLKDTFSSKKESDDSDNPEQSTKDKMSTK